MKQQCLKDITPEQIEKFLQNDLADDQLMDLLENPLFDENHVKLFIEQINLAPRHLVPLSAFAFKGDWQSCKMPIINRSLQMNMPVLLGKQVIENILRNEIKKEVVSGEVLNGLLSMPSLAPETAYEIINSPKLYTVTSTAFVEKVIEDKIDIGSNLDKKIFQGLKDNQDMLQKYLHFKENNSKIENGFTSIAYRPTQDTSVIKSKIANHSARYIENLNQGDISNVRVSDDIKPFYETFNAIMQDQSVTKEAFLELFLHPKLSSQSAIECLKQIKWADFDQVDQLRSQILEIRYADQDLVKILFKGVNLSQKDTQFLLKNAEWKQDAYQWLLTDKQCTSYSQLVVIAYHLYLDELNDCQLFEKNANQAIDHKVYLDKENENNNILWKILLNHPSFTSEFFNDFFKQCDINFSKNKWCPLNLFLEKLFTFQKIDKRYAQPLLGQEPVQSWIKQQVIKDNFNQRLTFILTLLDKRRPGHQQLLTKLIETDLDTGQVLFFEQVNLSDNVLVTLIRAYPFSKQSLRSLLENHQFRIKDLLDKGTLKYSDLSKLCFHPGLDAQNAKILSDMAGHRYASYLRVFDVSQQIKPKRYLLVKVNLAQTCLDLFLSSSIIASLYHIGLFTTIWCFMTPCLVILKGFMVRLTADLLRNDGYYSVMFNKLIIDVVLAICLGLFIYQDIFFLPGLWSFGLTGGTFLGLSWTVGQMIRLFIIEPLCVNYINFDPQGAQQLISDSSHSLFDHLSVLSQDRRSNKSLACERVNNIIKFGNLEFVEKHSCKSLS
jgi:hypothetical protein